MLLILAISNTVCFLFDISFVEQHCRLQPYVKQWSGSLRACFFGTGMVSSLLLVVAVFSLIKPLALKLLGYHTLPTPDLALWWAMSAIVCFVCGVTNVVSKLVDNLIRLSTTKARAGWQPS